MEIKAYHPLKNSPLELIELLRGKYGKSKNFDYFLGDFQKAFDFCVDNENIIFVPIAAHEGQKMQAHIALILDDRLPTGEALFGFFEVPEDASIFRLMWNSLVNEAHSRGISILKGPINGSIWHQYRCIKETDKSDFFKSELFCESYYYDLLSSNKPFAEIVYHSGYRERYQAILKAGQSAYDKLAGAGFFIREIDRGSLDKLQIIASLSKAVFQNSWGFTKLNQKEFLKLYSSEKLDSHLNKIVLLYKADETIGFCSTLKENDSTLICKAICVLPQYQGIGLGNALAFKVHYDAAQDGIKKIIYALVREDNNIKNFPKEDAVIFRRYAAFEFSI